MNVPGYEGRYDITEEGEVWTLGNKYNGYQVRPLAKQIKRGYYTVVLTKDGQSKTIAIHRLVALTFLPNPDNLPCVNHIDGNKLNNNVSNLEWCTFSDNSRHAFNNNISNFREKALNNLAKINANGYNYVRLWKDDGELHEFANTGDAAAFLGTHRDNLYDANKRKNGKCCGYYVFLSKNHGQDFANGEA